VARVIVLDAGVLIGFLAADDVFHDRASTFLAEHAAQTFAASALTVAETLVHPARAARLGDARRALAALQLGVLGLAADEAVQLAELRAATGLRMPDAVVVLAAERHGAELATTDAAVARAAEARGIPLHALR